MKINKSESNYTYINNSTSAAGARAVSPAENMSMSEYKKYIYDKISDISLNNSCLTAVNISEEGFEAMKNDPEYEKWVMDQISMSSGRNDSYDIYYFGKDRNSMRYECWKPEDMKKRIERQEKEKEFWKRKQKKALEAKMEHYAQYKRMLQENSIRKAELELNHINGIYDDYQKTSSNLNAASSYKAIMNCVMGSSEETEGSISVNVEKRSRQITSAKTSEQLKVILQMLQNDLSECKSGVQNGRCDENEVSKAEELIGKAEEKLSQLPADSENENIDKSFLLDMTM